MRILFFSHYFPPEVNAPANRTFEHCRQWAAAGHDVTVVTCAPNCPDGALYDGYRNRLFQREEMDGIRVVRVWTFLAANRGFARRVANYLSYLLSATLAAPFLPRPDVIVATTPQFFCGWAGVLAGLLRRAPLVLEVRDLWPDSIAAVGALKSRAALGLLGKLERLLYRSARHIVTVGPGYRANLIAKGVPPEKIAVIPNGVDLRRFAPRPRARELAARLGVAGKFVCSYIGTVGMAHGLEVVLGAAERLRGRSDIAFLVVGGGAQQEALARAKEQRGLANVLFAGRQPREAVPDLLSITDAALIHLRSTPLFRTVLPSKLFEAMAAARPIILGVEGDAADLLRRAQAGLAIPPEDPQALAQAVVRLREHPDEARRLGHNGLAYVREQFDRGTLAARYLDLLARVDEKAASPALAMEGADG